MRPITTNYTAPHIQKHNFNINYPRRKKPSLDRKETARRKTKNLLLRLQNRFLNHPPLFLGCWQCSVPQDFRLSKATFSLAMVGQSAFFSNAGSFFEVNGVGDRSSSVWRDRRFGRATLFPSPHPHGRRQTTHSPSRCADNEHSMPSIDSTLADRERRI